MGSVRTACSFIATSIYVSIISNQLTKYLSQTVTPAATEAGLPVSSLPTLFTAISAAVGLDNVPGITPEIEVAVGHAVKHAYSLSFRTVFLCTLPFRAIILVAAVISPNVEDYMTNDVARRLQDLVANEALKERRKASRYGLSTEFTVLANFILKTNRRHQSS